ncbi:DUF3087 domain-containing protein [Stutzerimonas tarimensis]|uniref:DUF3087 domain-containing protein n=1 Tax=Stutzerimonas tarimensis TaxID=1507735 RepID=A0ABV7T3X5_9GAMM
MFEITPFDPESYRRQTRKSSLVVIAIFAALGMGLATLSVALFGEPGGNNFRWNLAGILAGLVLTVLIVRHKLWHQPFMAAAAYGWQLKRNLMRITNVMHQVEAGVAAGDPAAMKLLRFYHLGVAQMHRLDGNSSAEADFARKSDQHLERMQEQDLAPEQTCYDPAWLEAVKKYKVAKK